MSILEKIKIIARDLLGIDPDMITEDMRLVEDLGITDVQAYQLYAKAQEIFPGLTATLTEAKKLHTIGDVVELVRRKTGESY